MARILLLRHGQTEWSASGRHTGRSDIPLTDLGRARARQDGERLRSRSFGLVLCSPAQRARETAELAGLRVDEVDGDLLEWDYGGYEGLTLAEIRAQIAQPEWVIWDGPIPPGHTPGETPEEVASRAERVIARCVPILAAGQDCALVAHGHYLRILSATWLGLPARDGRMFALDTGSISWLGFERTQRVISVWNHLPEDQSSEEAARKAGVTKAPGEGV